MGGISGARGTPPWWAILGTAVFIVVVPGTVIGVVPSLLSQWRFGAPLLGWEWTRWLGAALIAAGAPIFVDFVARFVWEGHGTPAPVAPTRHLVVGGPFRYVRNPGYVAVIAILVGEALLFGSRRIFVYGLAMAVAFHLFVVLYEEPALRRTFGEEFDAYCRRVPRWLPRVRAARPPKGPVKQ